MSTAKDRPQVRLGAFLYPTGHHVASWLHPEAEADAGSNFAHYVRLAQAAEAAKFDLIFFADTQGVRGNDWDVLSRIANRYVAQFEPLTLLSALAAVTRNIGLVGTVSSTYNHPWHVARKLASLDHLSGGRAAWNLVTSSNEDEALNFNLDAHPHYQDRYRRAHEFARVVKGLWDSFEDDALLRDKDSGIFADAAKIHPLDHHGDSFKVKGPLNVARPIQGHPVIVQAGQSEPGKELAAETAEAIFTATPTLADGQAFYADVKGRLPRYGRTADDVKILPGLFPVVGRSEQEARDKFQILQDRIHPKVGLSLLSGLGIDLSGYPLDGPLPELPVESNASPSRQNLFLDLARRENLTIRELYLKVAGARGHVQIIGTPQQIADEIETRVAEKAADGFNIMPPWLPGGLDDFIELVLPELRRRGIFRQEYEGRTLRENLGLKRPPGRIAPARAAAE